ncbi:hypothetical protein DFH08DRAFT_455922 [Mycena albidolilacea]|uniref:GATA-type domain-containing protein n=1 Tax=Mycena albidolilacea TaxID=1033008 RepID=A0AAD7EBV4_9AGAR|nr:hypothetical protein DFH08DRAFT_455922 [Mycena albidolilacea]
MRIRACASVLMCSLSESGSDVSSVYAESGSPPGSALGRERIADWVGDLGDQSEAEEGGPAPDARGSKKMCSHCHATSTPLWRRDPVSQRPLCNACGLYLQQRNKLRPQELIEADDDDADGDYSDDGAPDAEYTGPKCSHCLTLKTSVWRRSKTGAQVCNACGVYERLRGKERPLSLRRNRIKPYTKHLAMTSRMRGLQ